MQIYFGTVVSKQGHEHGNKLKKVEKDYERLRNKKKEKKIDAGTGPEKLWMPDGLKLCKARLGKALSDLV